MPANVDSMMYYGKTPWHGVGRELEAPATAKEAIKAAGLNWSVESCPMFAKSECDTYYPVPDTYGIVRSDTKAVLGTVGRLYTPLQNEDAFSFFDSVIGEGQAVYHVAGSLGKGERIWALAKMPNSIRIKKTDDLVERYLLLVNAHDGSMSLKMFFTPIRVVCQNTLIAALGAKKKNDGISIRHFPDIHKKVGEAQRALGIATKAYGELGEMFDLLAGRQVKKQWLNDYIEQVIPASGDEASARIKCMRLDVGKLFESPSNTVKGIGGTAWAAYNAVTEYVDHFRVVPKIRQDNTKRLSSIWLGSGAAMKRRALEVAVKLAA